VYIFQTVIILTNLQRYSKLDHIASKKNKLLCLDYAGIHCLQHKNILIAHWHYIFYDFQVENCVIILYIFLSIEILESWLQTVIETRRSAFIFRKLSNILLNLFNLYPANVENMVST
jgi:hypothetical protein